MTERKRDRFTNLVLALLAGELDQEGRRLLRTMLADDPGLQAELESSRELREALTEGVERAEPPEGFARQVRERLAASDPPAGGDPG